MDINLIPAEMRPRRPSRAPYLFASMVYVFTALFFGTKVGVVARFHRVADSDRKLLATLNSNLGRYAGANAKLESMVGNASDLMEKVENFKSVKKEIIPLGAILCEIGNLVCEGIWFEEFSISYPSEEVHLKGFGIEPVEDKVFGFVYGMKNNENLKRFFSDVKLVSCIPVSGKENLKTFDIVMIFKSGN